MLSTTKKIAREFYHTGNELNTKNLTILLKIFVC